MRYNGYILAQIELSSEHSKKSPACKIYYTEIITNKTQKTQGIFTGVKPAKTVQERAFLGKKWLLYALTLVRTDPPKLI